MNTLSTDFYFKTSQKGQQYVEVFKSLPFLANDKTPLAAAKLVCWRLNLKYTTFYAKDILYSI